MAGIFGEFFLVSVSHETKRENSSKKSGKIRSKIRGKIRDENSKNSGNFRSAIFLTELFFSAQKSGNLSTFWGDFLANNYTENLEKEEENPLEKKKNQWKRRSEIADVCPLSWSNAS